MRWRILIIGLTAAVLLFAANGCAGSRNTEAESPQTVEPDNYDEIEKLLGITPEGNNQTNTQEQAEAEYMQSMESGESAQSEVSHPAAQQEELQKEVEELEAQLREKNKMIADLKMQLSMAKSKSESQKSAPSVSMSRLSATSMSDAEYESLYREAYQLFSNHQYRQAMEIFKSLVASNPDHNLADNAQYWTGECYYLLGDYRAAILAFEKVFTFKNSNKNADAQYKLGLCYYHLKDYKRARLEFQTFVDNYQNSKLVRKAQSYPAKL